MTYNHDLPHEPQFAAAELTLDRHALVNADLAYMDEPTGTTSAQRTRAAITAYLWAIRSVRNIPGIGPAYPSLNEWRAHRAEHGLVAGPTTACPDRVGGSVVPALIVLMSKHQPEACDDGEVTCSCGNPLYVGHLIRLIAHRLEAIENPETTTTDESEH